LNEPYLESPFGIPVPLLTGKGNPRAKPSFALNHWVSMAATGGFRTVDWNC
jgi:hypothetical protein